MIGCQGAGCNQGRTPELCDCHNRQIVAEVHAEFETLAVRDDYDEADAISELGHRLMPWLCTAGILGVVAAILLAGA